MKNGYAVGYVAGERGGKIGGEGAPQTKEKRYLKPRATHLIVQSWVLRES